MKIIWPWQAWWRYRRELRDRAVRQALERAKLEARMIDARYELRILMESERHE